MNLQPSEEDQARINKIHRSLMALPVESHDIDLMAKHCAESINHWQQELQTHKGFWIEAEKEIKKLKAEIKDLNAIIEADKNPLGCKECDHSESSHQTSNGSCAAIADTQSKAWTTCTCNKFQSKQETK